MTALDALNRARRAWERQHQQQQFDLAALSEGAPDSASPPRESVASAFTEGAQGTAAGPTGAPSPTPKEAA